MYTRLQRHLSPGEPWTQLFETLPAGLVHPTVGVLDGCLGGRRPGDPRRLAPVGRSQLSKVGEGLGLAALVHEQGPPDGLLLAATAT